MQAVTLPDHRYVPGQNARHPEDAFDEIRASAVLGYDPVQLASCEAFLAGLKYLHAGYFWEAHEVLEPVWMILPEDSAERRFVQGLIQLANGRLKLLMGRPKAALRLVGQARGLVPSGTPDSSATLMAVNVRDVHGWIDSLEGDVFLAL